MEKLEALLRGTGPDAPPPPGDMWDRPPDHSVLQVSVPDWVEEGILYEALIQVCADANITKSMVEVLCGAAAAPVSATAPAKKLVKRAALRLRGEPGMAAWRAAQVLGSLRSAWASAGMPMASVLCDMSWALAAGEQPPPGVNDSLVVLR